MVKLKSSNTETPAIVELDYVGSQLSTIHGAQTVCTYTFSCGGTSSRLSVHYLTLAVTLPDEQCIYCCKKRLAMRVFAV